MKKIFFLFLFIISTVFTSCTMLLVPHTEMSEHDRCLVEAVFDSSDEETLFNKVNSLVVVDTNSSSLCGYTYTYDNIYYNIEMYDNNLQLFVELKSEKTIEKYSISYDTIYDITLIHELCHVLNFSDGHGGSWRSDFNKYLTKYLEINGIYSSESFEYYSRM